METGKESVPFGVLLHVYTFYPLSCRFGSWVQACLASGSFVLRGGVVKGPQVRRCWRFGAGYPKTPHC